MGNFAVLSYRTVVRLVHYLLHISHQELPLKFVHACVTITLFIDNINLRLRFILSMHYYSLIAKKVSAPRLARLSSL